MTTPSVEQRAKISNQISAMQQARKLHSHDWIVLMRLIGESLTLLDTLSQSLTEAQGEIARLTKELTRVDSLRLSEGAATEKGSTS